MILSPAALMKHYEHASNIHDIDAVLAMIDDEAVYLFSNGSAHIGKEEVERTIRRNFTLINDESYSIDNVKWVADGDTVAACVYDYSWSGTIGGEPASGFGRGTTVMRRFNTKWRIVHEHLSNGRFVE